MPQNFIQTYFLDPIARGGWFNPVNTLVYGLILILAAFGVYKLLEKLKIPIDSRFALAILPFIFWGSSTRVLRDAGFHTSPYFVTPGSYFITFALAFAVFLISLLIQKRTSFPYWKSMLIAGTALSITNLLFLPITTLLPLAIIIPTAVLLTLPFLLTHRFIPAARKTLSLGNIGILSAHFLDAAATVTALSLFGYLEQHVVPRLLLPHLGPGSMFFLKAAVVLPVLWIIDHYAEEPSFRNFLKIIVLILGLAPGLRDLLRLIALV